MAIEKEKTLDNGAVGNYWKIVSVKLDRVQKSVQYAMSLFAAKSYADVGASLGSMKDFSFDVSDEEEVGDLVALGYTKIKALGDADLVGGIDV